MGCSRGCICEYGASTKDEYVVNMSASVLGSDIECAEDDGYLVLLIIVGVVMCACCGTCCGLCFCYHRKRCCWQPEQVEAQMNHTSHGLAHQCQQVHDICKVRPN